MMPSVPAINLDALRATGAVPHWFGLGFVQLKLDEDRRLHFWHPSAGQITPEEELHDHRYDFTSRVLAGEMIHEVWDWHPDADGDHEMLEVSCKPGVAANPEPVGRGWVTMSGRHAMRQGESYSFKAGLFHRGSAHRAITFLTRGPVVSDMARVIHPIGMPSVCPFSAPRTEAECWDMIADMVDAWLG